MTPSKPLWQHGLDWLVSSIGGSTHWLDRERARRLARGMRMVGEDPSYRQVSAYVGELWGEHWSPTAGMVRDSWRAVYRGKTSVGRDTWHDAPLYEPDMLIQQHGLEPVTEVRLAEIAHHALDGSMLAAQASDTPGYKARKGQLDAALTAIEHLRYLRLGSRALGVHDPTPDRPPRPKWW